MRRSIRSNRGQGRYCRAAWLAAALAGVGGLAGPPPRAAGAPLRLEVVGVIAVAAAPSGVAVNPVTHRVYVSNTHYQFSNDASLMVIDPATFSVISNIAVPNEASAVAVNPVTNRIYVTSRGGQDGAHGTLSVIDGATNTLIASFPVGQGPSAVAVNPLTNRIYVAHVGGNTVSVYDGGTHALLATLAVGKWPYDLVVNPTTGRVYVANFMDNTVSVIDGATHCLLDTLPAGKNPSGVRANPRTNRVYVLNSAFGVWPPDPSPAAQAVAVYDGASHALRGYIPAASGPFRLAVDTTNDRLYVTGSSDKTVIQVIDGATQQRLGTAQIDDQPTDVAVDPGTGKVYTTHYYRGTLSVLADPLSLSPREAIVGLRAWIGSLGHAGLLGFDYVDPARAPLEAALAALDLGSRPAAITQLQAFIDHMNALSTGEHWQPDLTRRLVADAAAIIARLKSNATS
jgi:YVTN family beta-propeller protein